MTSTTLHVAVTAPGDVIAKRWYEETRKNYPFAIAMADHARTAEAVGTGDEVTPEWYRMWSKTTNFCTCKLLGRGRLWLFPTETARSKFKGNVKPKDIEEEYYAG